MKYLVFLTLAIVTALTLTEDYVYASCCPPGMQDTTITDTITDGIDSCIVDINFCHKIDPTGVRKISICSVTVPSGCNLNINLADGSFWEQIFFHVIDFSNEQLSFPPCNPSNPTAVVTDITRASCWILKNDWQNQQYVLEPCEGEAFCYSFYEVCWDSGVLTKTPISSHGSGSVDCTYEDIDDYIFHPDTFPFDECFDTCY